MLKGGFAKRKRRMLDGWKSRRAVAGIDAAILLGTLALMMAVLADYGPQFVSWLADYVFEGENGAYSLLIELPILDSKEPPPSATVAQWIGHTADNLYSLMLNIALPMFAVVLIIAGICYALESFKIMGEGTAANIITNSVFTFILIFAAKPVYNLVATAINAFTGWPDVGGSGLIIESGQEIKELISAMAGGVLPEELFDIGPISIPNPVRFLGSVIIFIISSSILLLSAAMGIVRILLIGCLAGILPLLLVLRLIPPVRNIARELIQTVIGIMFASVLAAIFLHFGYTLIQPQTNIKDIQKMFIAIAAFAGCAYMSTFFAGRLGALFSTMGSVAGMAVSTGTGLLMAATMTGAGMAAGGIAGWAGAPKGASRLAEAVKGAGTGFVRTAATVLPAAVTGAGPGAVFSRGVSAVPAISSDVTDLIGKKEGTMFENMLRFHAGTADIRPEDVEAGAAFKEELAKMSNAEVYQHTAALFPELKGLHKDSNYTGGEVKKFLMSLPAPVALRVWDRIREIADQGEEARISAVSFANKKKNILRAREGMAKLGRGIYNMGLEKLDSTRDPAVSLLTPGTFGEAERTAFAKVIRFTKDRYREGLSKDVITDIITEWGNKTNGFKAEALGKKLSEKTGEAMVGREVKMAGYRFGNFLLRSMKRNPEVAANILYTLEDPDFIKAAANPKFTEAAVKTAEYNEKWLHNKLAEGSGVGAPPPSTPKIPDAEIKATDIVKYLFGEETSKDGSLIGIEPGKKFNLIDLQRNLPKDEIRKIYGGETNKKKRTG